MKHFVVKHVFQIPARHERLIEQGMNSDYAVLFLDCSKNEMIFRRLFATTAPLHFVIAKATAKISLIHFAKKFTEIEMLSLLPKI